MQGLKGLELSGYKSIGDIRLELRPLNILIGANGAGKSNLLSFFKLLNDAMAGRLQFHVGERGGASSLLHHGIKRTPQISTRLEFHSNEGVNSYFARLVGVAPDTLMFAEETITFRRHVHPEPRQFVLGGGHLESQLGATIDARGPASKMAQYIKYRLDRWRFYHFHDTSATAAVKQMSEINDNRHLRVDAGNLAAYLYMLRQAHPAHYARIRDTVRMAVPGFDDFVLEPSPLNPERILLKWRELEADMDFTAHHLSDGSLRFICLSTLLLQPLDPKGNPNAPYTILIDEPELGLHPYAITLLASMIKIASHQTQIILSTQSTALIDAIDEPEAIIVVEKKGRSSTFKRLQEKDLEQWLEEYSLGELWEKNVLGGRP